MPALNGSYQTTGAAATNVNVGPDIVTQTIIGPIRLSSSGPVIRVSEDGGKTYLEVTPSNRPVLAGGSLRAFARESAVLTATPVRAMDTTPLTVQVAEQTYQQITAANSTALAQSPSLVQDWARRMLRDTGQSPTTAQVVALTRFVHRATGAGYLSKILDMTVLAGADRPLATRLVKLKAYPGSPSSLVNTGLTEADCGALGVTGGAGRSLSTGVNYASLTSGFGGLAAWIASNYSPASEEWIMGVGTGSAPQMVLAYNAGAKGAWGGSNNAATISQGQAANPGYAAPGLYHVERVSTTLVTLYANGLGNAVNTGTVTTDTRSAVITVLSGVGALNSSATVGLALVTDGTMTDDNALDLAADAERLMADLGALTRKQGPLLYVPVVGQSLARGAVGTPVVSTTQPYLNRMFGTGVVGGNPGAAAPAVWTFTNNQIEAALLAPLTERSAETISSGFANYVSWRARQASAGDTSQDTAHGNWAVGATNYAGLKKGTNPYANGVLAVKYLRNSALQYATEEAVQVPAVLCVHGESDAGSSTYQADVTQWQADYETDLKAATYQSRAVPMLVSQHSSWTSTGNINAATALSPYGMLAAAKANPAKIVMVCAKYHLAPYAPDGVHLGSGEAYRRLGEYYGKAYYQHVVLGQTWSPLRIVSATRVGAVVTLSFVGRVGDLVLDTAAVSDPGNFGFEWAQTGGVARTIQSVALSSDKTQAVVTLTGDPGAPTTQRIRYAYTGIPGNSGGPTTGPRGCLRDSDPAQSPNGYSLVNWLVHSDEAVL